MSTYTVTALPAGQFLLTIGTDYIAKADYTVSTRVSGVDDPDDSLWVDLVEGVDYTWPAAGVISLTVPSDGATDYRTVRATPRVPVVEHAPGVFSSAKANLLETQREYVDEEQDDKLGSLDQRAVRAPVGEVLINMPRKVDRAGKLLAFTADGDPQVVALDTTDTSLRSDLARSTGTTAGDSQIGSNDGAGGTLWTSLKGFITYLRSNAGSSLISYTRIATGAVTRPLTAKLLGYVDVEDFGAVGNGTTDDTAAWTAAITYVKTRSLELRASSPSYKVGELTLDGSDWSLKTNGALFQQKTGLTGDGLDHPIFKVTGTRIHIDRLRLQGNIASDLGEHSHGLSILSAKDIHIGHVHGENLMGDVVYVLGTKTSEATKAYGINIGTITGDQVLRNILTVTGGEVRVGSVRRVGTGRVGYKDIDVEPNAVTGTANDYQEAVLSVDHVRGAQVQVVSGDTDLTIKSVRFGAMDLDGSRIANTSPAYGFFPGDTDYALTVDDVAAVHVGHIEVANYKFSPIKVGRDIGVFSWDSLTFNNVAYTDAVYGTVILQLGANSPGIIKGAFTQGTHFNNHKMIFRSDTQRINLDLGKVQVTGGLFGVHLTGKVTAIDIDCGNSPDVAFSDCYGMEIGRTVVTNSTATYGFYDCEGLTLRDWQATFGGGLDFGSLSSNIVAVNSSINGTTADGTNYVIGGAIRVNGTKVLGAQGAAITDALTAGSATAANCATTINLILARMRAATTAIA